MTSAPVVDTDVHLLPGPSNERLADHMEEPYAGRLRDRSPPSYTISGGWDRRLGGKIAGKTVADPEELQRDVCDGLGVDYPVINPTLDVPKIPEPDLAVAVARAYNDLVLADFLDDNEHFFSLISLAPQRPEAAAEEIERVAGEDQFVGAFLMNTGPTPPLGDPAYDVIYRAAEDHGLPVVYHATAAGFFREFPRQHDAFDVFLPVHCLAHVWSHMLTVTSLVVNGTPAKFPDLDFVFLEGGFSWIPYMFRLNKEYAIRRSEAPLLERSPESYVREFYFSTQPFDEPDDRRDMERLLGLIEPEQILFSSDYPHWDFDDPSTIREELSTYFDDRDVEKVFGANAIEVFGLPV